MGDRNQFDFQAQKSSWTINLPASEVLKACNAKRDHHDQRLTAWREKELQAVKDIQEKGIDFREAARAGVANIHQYAANRGDDNPMIGATAGTQYQQDPFIKAEFIENLKEAQAKVASHLNLLRIYTQWQKMLTLMPPNHRLTLNFDDASFFDLGAVVQVGITEPEAALV